MANSRGDAPGPNDDLPLVSEFAGDPDMRDLIEYFLGELQQGVQQLANAWAAENLSELRTLSHQLKGAAGGYGFPSITACAAEVESLLKAGEAEAAQLAEKLEQLIALCRRAAACPL
jgi:HPt (histidine-containing phosphotransfer) domain-containing protein